LSIYTFFARQEASRTASLKSINSNINFIQKFMHNATVIVYFKICALNIYNIVFPLEVKIDYGIHGRQDYLTAESKLTNISCISNIYQDYIAGCIYWHWICSALLWLWFVDMYGTNLFYQVWYNVETEAKDKHGSEIKFFC
jgi:hypothetical protein